MRNFSLIILFISFVIQGQTEMTTSEASDLKRIVKNQANTTQTISSDFIQYKHLDFLSNDIVTHGKLVFKAPNLVKWEYIKPYNYSVIFKDESLFIKDEGKKSNIDMSSSKLFKQLNNLIINSIKGDMFNDDEFEIEYYNVDTNSLVYFNPKSNKTGKYIDVFHLTFNSKGDVIEVIMFEPSGDYTRLVFENKFINKPINDAVFTH